MSSRTLLKNAFKELLEKIRPEKLIEKQCRLEKEKLIIQNTLYNLKHYQNIYILGSGKAVVPMASIMQKLLKTYKPKTLLVGAYEFKNNFANTTYVQSTHPIPSKKSIEAAGSLKSFMNSMQEDDLYIYLLSGGNSALVEEPENGIGLDDFKKTTNIMLHGGMPIAAINSVRKHLSKVKGGKLALQSKAEGIILVMSDVLGNDLNTIGSAPLYCDNSSFADAIKYLKSYSLFDKIPQNVQKFLLSAKDETPKTPLKRVRHFIVGTNEIVLQKAKEIMETKGLKTVLLDMQISGDVKDVAQKLHGFIKDDVGSFKRCYIAGGEATVVVDDKYQGKGGRNQHLCLHFLNLLGGRKGITFLSGATDGVDGNSTAAGAVVDSYLEIEALSIGLDFHQYLEHFDSNTFFSKTDALLISGPTNNNLLDIAIILVEPKISIGV